MKSVITRIALFVLVTSIIVSAALSGYAYIAYADSESVKEKYEQINVMDDLKDSTQNGNGLDLNEYNFDESKETQIYSFVEFCYSFRAVDTTDYGLYVYIYNPKGLNIDTDSALNAVTMRYGDNAELSFTKYRLKYLNCSTGDYYGLFYKFALVLSDSQKTDILRGRNRVNSSCRKYEVAELELKAENNNNATSVAVDTVYEFTGYAKGYGADETADTTLTVTAKGGQESISLEVKPTYYRPEGTNGKNDYTQDSLHSVYFAVPNHYIDKYGEMYAVHATWLNAVLKPMLVTGNQSAYNTFFNYLGVENSEYNKEVDYMYVGGDIITKGVTKDMHDYGYLLNNILDSYTSHTFGLSHTLVGNEVNVLYGIFDSGNDCDSADTYTVRSDKIYKTLTESADLYGGELVNGKFSKAIFESIDENFTEVNISRDETYKLTSQKLTQTFWEKLWGQASYTTMPTENISAIEKVDDDKISGNKTQDCDRLYISVADYDEFVSYYKKYAKSAINDYGEECTVFLFRYMVSDYIAQEATLYKYKTRLDGGSINKVDTNASFFQETVNLDFDIIDLTFIQDDVKTVIPVIMSPIDIVHDATPPVYTTSDRRNNILALILGILGLIILLLLLAPFLPSLITLLVKILVMPFKVVIAVFNRIGKSIKKKSCRK